MRNILFRGKRTENGEWIGGYFGIKRIFRKDGKEKEIYCIMQETCDCRCEYTYFTDYQVDAETVGQWTGLIDPHGKKIFEGDIVKYGDTIHKVVFEQRNGTAYFGLVYNELETLPFGHYQDLRQIEVIGNIHDNPELIE